MKKSVEERLETNNRPETYGTTSTLTMHRRIVTHLSSNSERHPGPHEYGKGTGTNSEPKYLATRNYILEAKRPNGNEHGSKVSNSEANVSTRKQHIATRNYIHPGPHEYGNGNELGSNIFSSRIKILRVPDFISQGLVSS
jgi:hypothetical protein